MVKTMTRHPPFIDTGGLLTWLGQFRPADQIRTARLLADTHTTREVAAAADALVYDLTRDASRADVADHLGTTVRAVQRAISAHIARTGAEGRRGPDRRADSQAATTPE